MLCFKRSNADGDGQSVADVYRFKELQSLPKVNGARARKLSAQHSRNQRATQHAVRDDLAKWLVLAYSASTCARFTSPETAANSWMSRSVKRRTRLALLPTQIPANGRFSIKLADESSGVMVISFILGLAHDVTAAINKNDVAGQGSSGIAA